MTFGYNVQNMKTRAAIGQIVFAAAVCLSGAASSAAELAPKVATPAAAAPGTPGTPGTAPTSPAHAAPAASRTLFVEDLTWREVQAALNAGMVHAILYAGSTEQNGPHMTLGKHNRIARWVAERLAQRLGSTLIYPIVPFAPTGDAKEHTGHMRFPGSVSLHEATFAGLMSDLAWSARAAGFKVIFLMGDHGGGQKALERLAQTLDQQWRSDHVRVFYVGDLYFKSAAQVSAELTAQHLPQGEHAGIEDTAALMYIDPTAVRFDRLGEASARTGVNGDPRPATPALGERLVAIKVDAAYAQMRAQLDAAARGKP